MNYIKFGKDTMQRILNKLEKTAPEIGARFPHAAKRGVFDEKNPDWWTSGFWPGILWMAYQQTKDEKYAGIARKIEEKMDEALERYELLHHDVGFMWILSSGANYKLTGDEKSRLRLLKASNYLAGRFNIKGNFIRAWNRNIGGAIIDCLMNLTLLYWAANETEDPRFAHIAEAHINTVLKYFVRSDGSVNHIVLFNPESGEFIESLAGQGSAADSAWSRGTAWAIYGLALAYRYFKAEEMLMCCKKVSNFFLTNLPDDYVAHWDFRVERTEETPRDTSAAACAACGLLELSKYLPSVESDMYLEKAYLILKSLTESYSNLDDDAQQSILRCGTGNLPANENVNVGLIYGDYFYMEGISRMAGNDKIFWYTEPKKGNVRSKN